MTLEEARQHMKESNSSKWVPSGAVLQESLEPKTLVVGNRRVTLNKATGTIEIVELQEQIPEVKAPAATPEAKTIQEAYRTLLHGEKLTPLPAGIHARMARAVRF